MVTIKDIARESGYSISTVSRVLNHRNDVSPDAKKKIEEVVEKFHFVPNNNAKHLKQSNTKTIVVLVKGISNMLFSNIVEEIQQMMEEPTIHWLFPTLTRTTMRWNRHYSSAGSESR